MGLIEKNDNGSWKLKGVGWSQIKPGAVINILRRYAITSARCVDRQFIKKIKIWRKWNRC